MLNIRTINNCYPIQLPRGCLIPVSILYFNGKSFIHALTLQFIKIQFGSWSLIAVLHVQYTMAIHLQKLDCLFQGARKNRIFKHKQGRTRTELRPRVGRPQKAPTLAPPSPPPPQIISLLAVPRRLFDFRCLDVAKHLSS